MNGEPYAASFLDWLSMTYFPNRIIVALVAAFAMWGCGESQNGATVEVKQAEKKAQSEFDELRKKAESGDAQAQFDLAIRYEGGDGVEANQSKAFEWFLKAGENGNIEGMAQVARAYQQGLGIAKDADKAKTWTKKAAEAGHAQAQFIHARTFGSTDRVTYIWALLSGRFHNRINWLSER